MLFLLLILLLFLVIMLAWDIVEYTTEPYKFKRIVLRDAIKYDLVFIGMTLVMILIKLF